MKTIIKMAWRNIWRNKRRTILTMFSIFLAMLLSLFTRSMQKGSYANMITNVVKFSTGYIQIHKKGYWEDKSINNTFTFNKSILQKIKKEKNVTIAIPRLESFALASSGNYTKGTLVVGTDIELENKLNHYSEKIIRGSFLHSDDRAIIVAEKLAEFLRINVGDTLVLMGQGYHGITAAEQYPVKGIIHFPIPQLNNRLIIMPLKEAQYYYGANNRLTSISIMLSNPDKLETVIHDLQKSLGKKYEIMSWQEMNREMVQAIESDNIGGIIMLAILYLVVGFGVFGTILMMTMERRKEFAVMIAVGMQKTKLLLMVLYETILIGMIAIVVGLMVTYPILLYMHYHPIKLTGEIAASMTSFGAEPIMPFSLQSGIFISQTISVIAITIIAVIYPLSVLLKFKVLKAMRS